MIIHLTLSPDDNSFTLSRDDDSFNIIKPLFVNYHLNVYHVTGGCKGSGQHEKCCLASMNFRKVIKGIKGIKRIKYTYFTHHFK